MTNNNTTTTKIVSIAAAVAAIALCIGVAIPLVGINMSAQAKEPSLGELTPLIPQPEIEVPEVYIPQSFAPTDSFLEEGEIVYYGWKVDRTEPVVEEPEVEEPEEPVTPQKPTKPGCYHGYMNPAFCPVCWLNTPHLPGFGSMPGC